MLFETSVIIKRIRKNLVLFFLATLCRERYLTREEMKTQYKKTEKKRQSHNHKYRFSVLTSKRKTHFRDSCQVHHGIN